MPATKRAVVGALVGAGGLLVTVALVGLTATSSAALPAAIGFASVEKAVRAAARRERFASRPCARGRCLLRGRGVADGKRLRRSPRRSSRASPSSPT